MTATDRFDHLLRSPRFAALTASAHRGSRAEAAHAVAVIRAWAENLAREGDAEVAGAVRQLADDLDGHVASRR